MRYIFILLYVYVVCAQIDEYNKNREKLLRDEALLSVGGETNLTNEESVVNDCLMRHKFNEIDYGFDNPQYYNFSHHFFSYMHNIKKSKVYKIIKDMPKGAALHIHDMGILGPDYVMNITYMEDLYICIEKDDVSFKFSNTTPTGICNGQWRLINETREASNNVTEFDAKLRKSFTIYNENPDKAYPSIKDSWDTFQTYFTRIIPLLTYQPVWEQYFYDVLKQFRSDNIMYLEVRTILPNLYELNGSEFNILITAKSYKKAIRKFMKDYPDFLGAKLIFAPGRNIDQHRLDEYLRLALAIKADMPETFAGFDLVGQEDTGRPLIEFVPQLLNHTKDLNYYFHAGETNWFGTMIDENLVDAILLGAKRIGHAYALPKHPLLMKEVIDREIAIEVNVISNNVLSLVRDVRNHPLSSFLAQGMPVVISSDDPGIWEADSLADDFYVAFVGVASRLSDLRLLKQLAINSLKYSALNSEEKCVALNKFESQWNEFINHFDCSRY